MAFLAIVTLDTRDWLILSATTSCQSVGRPWTVVGSGPGMGLLLGKELEPVAGGTGGHKWGGWACGASGWDRDCTIALEMGKNVAMSGIGVSASLSDTGNV